MRTLALVAAALLVTACSKKKDKPAPTLGSGTAAGSAGGSAAQAGSDDEATAVEPDTGSGAAGTPSTGKMKPTVDLTLTGSVTAKLKGTAGTCSCRADNANITLRSDDFKVQPSFDLNILVTSAEEWTNPAMIINVKAPQRGSYGRNAARRSDGDKLSVAKDCSAVTIENAVLKGIASKGEIVVKGLITCAP
jgi:hypothetical protein